MNTFQFPQVEELDETFNYDIDQPTLQTEKLSYHLQKILQGLYVTQAKLYVETMTPEEQTSAADSYFAEFKTWLEDSEAAVSEWLTQEEESRALPVLAAVPAFPASIGSAAVVLTGGLAMKLGTDIFSSVVRVIQQATANRRQAELVRVLDKALLRGSWFSLQKQSNLDEIEDLMRSIIEAISRISTYMVVDDKSYNYKGIGQALYDCLSSWRVDAEGNILDGFDNVPDMLRLLAKNGNIIKLLSKIILTHGGDIEEHEFILAGEDS